jgi:O-antigen/teichoic acid export membrane protein
VSAPVEDPAEAGADEADDDPDGPGEGPPLARQVRKAFTWSLAGLLVGRIGTLTSGIILARVLAPEDYGVFAVAQVVLVLVVNLNDLGLEQALVRWPGGVDRAAPTARTLTLASSVAQFAVMFVLAPVLASALSAPEATGIIQLLAFSVVINGLFAIPSAMLTRRFRQDLRTTADFIGFVVTTGLTLVLALSGVGVWSLAWGRLVGNTVNGTLHAIFARPGYRFGWNRVLARQLLSQGLPLAGTTILAVAVLNTDTLVVGRVLGPAERGFYTMAFNLSSWPVSVFAVAVWRVSVPAFSRLQDDPERLRNAFLRAFGLLMAVTLPVCVMLSALALPLIRFVYGEKWSAAALALTVLAALGALRVAMQLMTDLLVAVGRGRTSFALQAIWLAALVPALAVGSHLAGIKGAAWAHVLVALLIVVPLHLRAVRPQGIGLGALARAAARPLAGAAAAAVVAVRVGRVFAPSRDLPDFTTLAAAGFCGLAVFAVIVAPMRRTALAGLR